MATRQIGSSPRDGQEPQGAQERAGVRLNAGATGQKSRTRRRSAGLEIVRRAGEIALRNRRGNGKSGRRARADEVLFEVETNLSVEQLDALLETAVTSIQQIAANLETMVASRDETLAEMDKLSVEIERKQRKTQKLLDELCASRKS